MSGEHVLVIDDSPTVLKVVELVLTKAGFTVSTAADGDEGIALARQATPDLILLDFVMPRLNGYQVCQTLHREGLGDVPVILMSAKGDQVGERFVTAMGVVDYITKPFSPEAVTGIVQHTIDKHRHGAGSDPGKNEPQEASPQDIAAAAHGAVSARNAALDRLRAELTRHAARSVLRAASELSLSLNEADVQTWIEDGLASDTLELLLADLRASAPDLLGDGDTAMAGDMRVVPLAEVLTLLSDQEQTGRLTVARGTAQVELHFRDGRLEFATAVGVPEELLLGRFILENNMMTREEFDAVLAEPHDPDTLLGARLVEGGHVEPDNLKEAIRQQTRELVYEMLRWSFGNFTFRANDTLSAVAAEAALGLSVDGILMEGFRRVDEWHLIEREVDNFDVVFLRNEDAVNRMGRGRLTREELAVLELVNGKNTVKEIVRQGRMGSFEVSKMLYRLHSIKLIRKRVQPVAV